MIDDLKSMAVFVEAIKQGSFRGAAKTLGLSAPSISYNISELEKRLGCALIYRTTRKLSLTHEGEQLFIHAKKMLESAEQGIQALQKTQQDLRGHLRVTITSALLNSKVSRAVADFAHANPLINLSINFTDQQEDIVANAIDVAIRAGKLEDSSLKCKRLGSIERKLVCSKSYYENKQAPKHPKDLQQWDWINLKMMPQHRMLKRRAEAAVKAFGKNRISLNSVESASVFCRYGFGLATPPEELVRHSINDGSLLEVLPDWKVDPIDFYALWPNNASPSSLTRKLIKFLETTLN